MFKTIVKFLLTYIQVKPMLINLIDVHLEEFVMKAVKKSETTIDDAIVPLVYASLEKEALEMINNLDFDKMLNLEDEVVEPIKELK